MDNILKLAKKREKRRYELVGMTDDDLVLPPGQPMPNVRMFLAEKYSDDEDRYLLTYQGGQFYRYDGTCWPALEDQILKSELYRFFERKSFDDGKEIKPFAPTQRKTADLMDAARAIAIVPTDTPTPSWRQRNARPANEIVACTNGLVHW